MTYSTSTQLDRLEALIPRLRRFAFCMCGRRAIADECVEKALEVCASMVCGSVVDDLETLAFARTRQEVRGRSARATDMQNGDDDTPPSIQADLAFGSLSDDEKEVLLLVICEELTIAQSAEILGSPLASVIEQVVSAGRTYRFAREWSASLSDQSQQSNSVIAQPLRSAVA